jgi:hypothetical protein
MTQDNECSANGPTQKGGGLKDDEQAEIHLENLWYPHLRPIWKRIIYSVLLSIFIEICITIKEEEILPSLNFFMVLMVGTFVGITGLCLLKWKLFTCVLVAIMLFMDLAVFDWDFVLWLFFLVGIFYVGLAGLCIFLSHGLSWSQRSKYFRVTCFAVGCWVTASAVYGILFTPWPRYKMWSSFLSLALLPAGAMAVASYIYQRYIK